MNQKQICVVDYNFYYYAMHAIFTFMTILNIVIYRNKKGLNNQTEVSYIDF